MQEVKEVCNKIDNKEKLTFNDMVTIYKNAIKRNDLLDDIKMLKKMIYLCEKTKHRHFIVEVFNKEFDISYEDAYVKHIFGYTKTIKFNIINNMSEKKIKFFNDLYSNKKSERIYGKSFVDYKYKNETPDSIKSDYEEMCKW